MARAEVSKLERRQPVDEQALTRARERLERAQAQLDGHAAS